MAERLRKEIKRFRLVWQLPPPLRISASIGLAHSADADATENGISELFSRAENACREAKRLGGNRLHLYSDGASGDRVELQLVR